MTEENDDGADRISNLHAAHFDNATTVQRLLTGTVTTLSHPVLLVLVTLAVASWIALNLTMAWAGHRPLDPPPFEWLQGGASVAALIMTSLILTTQRREDELSRQRDQLTLELAIRNERKTSKIIALIEEARRDNPLVENRLDPDASAMARPADPGAVLDAIKDAKRSTPGAKGGEENPTAKLI